MLGQNEAESGIGVVLGADSLSFRRSGIGRMTLEIANAVRCHPGVAGSRLMLGGRLASTAILPRLEAAAADAPAGPEMTKLRMAKLRALSMPGIQSIWTRKAWLQQHHELRRLQAEAPGGIVYHEPNMILAPFRGTTVVTFNDLSWHHHPEMHPGERIIWIRRNLRRTFQQAARYIAISDFTARALSSEFGLPRERIDVVPLAASPAFRPVAPGEGGPALARYGLAERSYVLSVSTVEPRKNFDRLLRAHRSLPGPLRRRFPLAIVGGSGWGSALSRPDAAAAQAEGTLRLLGHVDDTDLVPLYACAAAFAYVSLYEGFGLPVIEAMAAGAPVVASSTTAVAETAADAAVLVDPLDVDAIAAALHRVLVDPAYADAMRARGAMRAAEFTWERTADLLVASWRRALITS